MSPASRDWSQPKEMATSPVTWLLTAAFPQADITDERTGLSGSPDPFSTARAIFITVGAWA